MIDTEIELFRLEYLKTIIDETEAKIVLSSSFRYFFDKQKDKVYPISLKGKKLYDKLKQFEIEIYDITSTTIGSREEQIKEWLSNKEDIESFVIIDDNSTGFYEYYDDLIHTGTKIKSYLSSFMKQSTGLCECHVLEAIERLNGKRKVLRKNL